MVMTIYDNRSCFCPIYVTLGQKNMYSKKNECKISSGLAGIARRLLLEGFWRKSEFSIGKRDFVHRESSRRYRIPVYSLQKLQRVSEGIWLCWNVPSTASWRNSRVIPLPAGSNVLNTSIGSHHWVIRFWFKVCASCNKCHFARGYAGMARQPNLKAAWSKFQSLRGERYFIGGESSQSHTIPIHILWN